MNLRASPRNLAASLFAALAISLLSASPGVAVTYTFENLSTGALVGQDNWMLIGSGGSFQITTGVGTDTTKVFQNPGVNAANFNIRQNDGNFSFGSFNGSETAAILQFDVKVNSSPNENQNMSFYLADVNGSVSLSPQIQYGNTSSGVNPVFAVVKAGGGSFTQALPGSVNFGDWVSVRLTMNFMANGGDGLGNVTMADLTQATGYSPVSGLQNLALGMSSAGVTPSAWNTIWLRSDLVSGLTGDNLTVIVPEPGGGWLALAGAMLLGEVRLRRRR